MLVTISGTTTLVLMAGMRAASVPLLMAVMVAVRIGVKDKISCKVIRNNAVSCAGNAAKQLNPGLCKSILRTGTNTAAENDIYTVLNKEAHQCTMALPIGRNDLTAQNLAGFCIVDFELCRVSEVLEHLKELRFS